MSAHEAYPIGRPGTPWGEEEGAAWLAAQTIQRSYADDVLRPLEALGDRFELVRYGELPHDAARYPLWAARTRGGGSDRPTVLVTGGVHGYETSGVQGALRFLAATAAAFADRLDIVVAPCVSPWGYETINRWNPDAVDPNRSFFAGSGSPEANQLMAWVEAASIRPLVHFDLHETTDTDNSEFRPALTARDGKSPTELSPIPLGFYTVAPAAHPEPAFQDAVIAAVAEVTPIAEPDPKGNIIDCPVQSPGVIHYDKQALHLCGGFTEARFVTTTEVYPDAPGTDPETCILAQVAAVRGGLDHLAAEGVIGG